MAEFYKKLAKRESNDNPRSENEYGFIGLYQMGEAALVDADYYEKQNGNYNNDWKGNWLGINNIRSKDNFLSSRSAQNDAIRRYHKRVWNNYITDCHRYEGKTVKDINITKSGMVAASHLVGQEGLRRFLVTNGREDKKDESGTPCSEYLRTFRGYDLDW